MVNSVDLYDEGLIEFIDTYIDRHKGCFNLGLVVNRAASRKELFKVESSLHNVSVVLDLSEEEDHGSVVKAMNFCISNLNKHIRDEIINGN